MCACSVGANEDGMKGKRFQSISLASGESSMCRSEIATLLIKSE